VQAVRRDVHLGKEAGRDQGRFYAAAMTSGLDDEVEENAGRERLVKLWHPSYSVEARLNPHSQARLLRSVRSLVDRSLLDLLMLKFSYRGHFLETQNNHQFLHSQCPGLVGSKCPDRVSFPWIWPSHVMSPGSQLTLHP
jgi:hypothetical protein